ncbi:hypothetical protein EV361DRAFT_909269 [Lentinula raphanica]|uniref:General stress protein FMN-binding split barrel domain-containing protein n=1 Tax=Lentinula raphanica TaxID=153919 RepID=A0AA38PJL5_9AGAR|nr:hypothetical protein EV360DRAFT_35848 [Lentinula raphanica]KAJ3827318.1 hypothetical protein F5880DRAFT_1474753 [Lentinula raphanica]KAJ3844162.1 hypothetical protein F5878DRAFT_602790 [Lentinula raphanica]KAJ3971757.1 hypothetical protein EV361DRAFT_909269 [Lentinula raphanica]
MTSTAHPNLDPYVAKAENNSLSPHEKIKDLHEIVKSVETGMLTTRASSGQMHSRAMIPTAPQSDTQTSLIFFANKASHKFDEIENDAHVNVSFSNPKTTSWASYAGVAKISQDKELIRKHWHKGLSAWFGDLKDNVHKGDENDPRVAIIQVIPDEIRYWVATKGAVSRALETGLNAVTGGVSVPGELRTITLSEIQLTQGLHNI